MLGSQRLATRGTTLFTGGVGLRPEVRGTVPPVAAAPRRYRRRCRAPAGAAGHNRATSRGSRIAEAERHRAGALGEVRGHHPGRQIDRGDSRLPVLAVEEQHQIGFLDHVGASQVQGMPVGHVETRPGVDHPGGGDLGEFRDQREGVGIAAGETGHDQWTLCRHQRRRAASPVRRDRPLRAPAG